MKANGDTEEVKEESKSGEADEDDEMKQLSNADKLLCKFNLLLIYQTHF